MFAKAGIQLGGGYGIHGASSGSSSSTGVYGVGSGTDSRGVEEHGKYGMLGFSGGVSDYDVYGINGAGGYAGYFAENVDVIGDFAVSGTKSFKIDHPLDPENKYLYHSCVESPDMKNIYDGTVLLDENGEAWVKLPDYFEALNKDYRYQLTCIGGYSQVYIAEEISVNTFKIAGGSSELKVSWQVTGTRQDAYSKDHPIVVEQYKPASERGTYLYSPMDGTTSTSLVGYVPPGK